MDEIKAFAVAQHIAAVAMKPDRPGVQPQVNLLSTAAPGLAISGKDALRATIAACQFALGESPEPPQKGSW